ncbi:zinc metallopeptidase [Tissierella carlieri]|uniref:Zinc metallopeptidase n=1 Tax=Tissierella carlieri TaxID=689904 RepID=A0ABT1S5V7_9FIRM|nr:zinc metallopeptidase [Tissierella carlieri]MBU5314175.1 zinc metallopeptidase [Tissierella carlieri]MCQ4921845.1 zinc metallopeptidase [Tissierella carlieri]MDU5083137.1 zinc metallopeptidase [Bacillota bacterium]
MIGNYYGGGYYSSWILFVLPAMLFASYAQLKISSAFNKYSRISSGTGYTGAQIARMILDRNGLHDVRVEQVGGKLTDHYDPRTKVVRLSSSIYGGNSIASMSVAAHEVGHAIQHAEGYFPLILRNNIAPIANIGSRLVWLFIIIGFAISPFFIELGIALFLAVVLFQIVTLPVEFNASSRALVQLENGIMERDKIKPAKDVLKAAALTYVAATLVAIGELLRLLALTSRRRD